MSMFLDRCIHFWNLICINTETCVDVWHMPTLIYIHTLKKPIQSLQELSVWDTHIAFLCVDSGAEYVRKEIPLHVLPTSSLVNLDSPLKSFTDLQRVLYEEERAAYNQAILQTMRFYFIGKYICFPMVTYYFVTDSTLFFIWHRDGKVHPLSFIHHTSTYQASMCKLIEYWLETNLFQLFVILLLLYSCSFLLMYSLSPAISALQDRLKENEIRVRN